MTKEKKKSEYKPLIVKAVLRTGNRKYEQLKKELKGQGFNRNEMRAMVREGELLDGLTVYLSKWNWDNHERWHLHDWEKADDEKVKQGIYETEQYQPDAKRRYKGALQKFEKDWKNQEYDHGLMTTFKDSEVEVIETIQEEEDNIDKEEVRKLILAAEEEIIQRSRRQRQHRKKVARERRYRKTYY